MMGLEVLSGIKGMGFLEKVNLQTIFSGVGNIVSLIVVVAIVAAISGGIYYWRKQQTLYDQKLHFFEEVNGQLIPIEDCAAAELTIPNTTIRVFYVKSKNLYMPRGTKKMGKKSYWYAIRNNREILNFTVKNINKELSEANLDYDHTDMRYAYSNLQEIIKRNYKDKTVKWWQEYKDLIGIVVFIFIFTLAFWFLIGKIGSVLDGMQPIADALTNAAEKIVKLESSCGGASGIKPA